MTGRAPGTESGSASVLVLGAAGVTVAALVAALAVAGGVRATHVARAAADRSALAAATGTLSSGAPDCGRATRVAVRSGARVAGCTGSADGSVEVTVEVPLPVVVRRWPGVPDATLATARAGVG